jgi:hypothetical protein
MACVEHARLFLFQAELEAESIYENTQGYFYQILSWFLTQHNHLWALKAFPDFRIQPYRPSKRRVHAKPVILPHTGVPLSILNLPGTSSPTDGSFPGSPIPQHNTGPPTNTDSSCRICLRHERAVARRKACTTSGTALISALEPERYNGSIISNKSKSAGHGPCAPHSRWPVFVLEGRWKHCQEYSKKNNEEFLRIVETYG